MTKKVIYMPASLDLTSATQFWKETRSLASHDHFELDFAGCKNIEPFGMLMIGGEIRRLRLTYPEAEISAARFSHMSYAGHMGFFGLFGLDIGKAPGEAPGSATYLPVTLLQCDLLTRRALESGRDIGDEVEAESKHIAGMLCGERDGAVHETLAYAIRELMRNVVEHSEAGEIELCAQFWPSKHKVEVAIIDRGIGLRQSLSHNPHLDASDDKRAINYALMPAVSGKAFKGAQNQRRGHWTNSGFGLYMTNRICRNGGNFFIASGNAGMMLTKTEGKRYFEFDHVGTAIRMVLKTDMVTDLRRTLERYKEEGFLIQQRYREIVSIDPSSASLMLSEDFDLSVWDRILTTLKRKVGGH